MTSREAIALATRAANAIAALVRASIKQQEVLTDTRFDARIGEDFLAIVSHKLRTPLSSMLMHGQRLRTGAIDADEVEGAGAAIERAAHAQKKLLDELLDAFRIVSGSATVEPTECDLCVVVEDAIASMRSQIDASAIELTVPDHVPCRVWGDPLRIGQVISNLLTNALKFTPKRGKITISIERTASGAHLSVSDTGIGIEPELIPALFDRLTKSGRLGVEGRSLGLGLGLPIVRCLMELHGGSVEVQSAGAGQGATFGIRFPALREART